MGLEFPILANSAITRLASLSLDSMVESFSMINSKAPATSTAYYYLFTNSSESLFLASSNSTSLLFKISNYEVLILISDSNFPISYFNKAISFSASS
jgi:hypothetical protein